MSFNFFRAMVIAVFITTFTACTTTPDYMAQVQMPEQQEEQQQATEQEPEKASGVPSWLWWVLGALAVGALASSSSSSEECLFVADSQGNLRECRPGE